MRVIKMLVAVLILLGAAAVGLWHAGFSFGTAPIHTQAHGVAKFSRGPGGTGGRRPIRFSVEGDPELVARVTKALAGRDGFHPGGAAELRPGEALATLVVHAERSRVTPVYAHSQVHLHAALASDGRLVELGPASPFTPALWSYPVVRGEYDLDVEGSAKGLVTASAYFDTLAARMADEAAARLEGALAGEGVATASFAPRPAKAVPPATH